MITLESEMTTKTKIFDNNDEGTLNIEPVENDRNEVRNENKIDNEQIIHIYPNKLINNVSDEYERQLSKGRDFGCNTDADMIMELRYGPRNRHYFLQPRKPDNYSHLHATLKHIALTQYSLKCGLQTFG
jgi:hypothetical protein